MRKVQAQQVTETLREGKKLPASGVAVVAIRTGPPDIGASTLKQNVALVDRLRRVAIRSDPPPANIVGVGFDDAQTLEIRKKPSEDEDEPAVPEKSEPRERLETGSILEAALPLVNGGPAPRFVPLAISFTNEPVEEKRVAEVPPGTPPIPVAQVAVKVDAPRARPPGDVTTDALPPALRARESTHATKAVVGRIATILAMALLAAAAGAAIQRGGQALRAHGAAQAVTGSVR